MYKVKYNDCINTYLLPRLGLSNLNEEYSDFQAHNSINRPASSSWFVICLIACGVITGITLGILLASVVNKESLPPALFDENMVSDIFARTSPSVVELDVGQSNSSASGAGSGFFIDTEGHIVTNHHVVRDADRIEVKLHEGRIFQAEKLGHSPADDLAVLKIISDEKLVTTALNLANSDDVLPGQMAIAIGSPFRNFNSITVGVVSGRGRAPISTLSRPIPDMIQTDAPLNSGNSGAPLLNSRGEVIGINSAVKSLPYDGFEEFRIGFAVPSNTLLTILPKLLISDEVRRPWLGISSRPIPNAQRVELGIPEVVAILSVFTDSPAYSIGLQPFRSVLGEIQGDVITAVDGRSVSSIDQIVSYFNELNPGDTITLSIYRNLEYVNIEATLAPWPDS